jgi:AcrR family transcriptional regulator
MAEATISKSTRDGILDATDRLLGRLGYRKTTIDDLAREAGVARRTIYLHFPSKEEIFLASIDRVVERLLGELRGIASAGGPPEERLRRLLLQRVLFRFDSVRDYHESLEDLLAVLRPAYLRRRERYFQAEAEILAEVIAEGRIAGILDCPDVLGAARTLVTATNSLLPAALSAAELGSRQAIEKEVALVTDLLLRGLLSRRPVPVGATARKKALDSHRPEGDPT